MYLLDSNERKVLCDYSILYLQCDTHAYGNIGTYVVEIGERNQELTNLFLQRMTHYNPVGSNIYFS